MQSCIKEISKEIYDKAIKNNGYITDEDEWKVFTESQIMGYGIYGTHVYEEDGKYYVHYSMGDTCD